MLRRAKGLIWILLGGIGMLTLFGCGGPRYSLRFDGYGFESDKSSYAAGETVTVCCRFIATDTDYRFWLDDEDVELEREYDEARGFVLRFVMPARDLTLHVSHRNSMLVQPVIEVGFRNEVAEADVWVLPQTEENRKSTLWGEAKAPGLGVGERASLELTESGEDGRWLVRVLDREQAYYAAQDLELADGDTIVFRTEGSKYDAVIEVRDASGSLRSTATAFVGVLGGE